MFFMDAQAELQLSNKHYLEAVQLYVWGAFRQDNMSFDISTRAFLGTGRRVVRAKVIAGEPGVLAGMQEAEWLLEKLKLKLIKMKEDGTTIKKGESILVFEGRASVVLSVERTLLNLLQRMSGVATKTKKIRAKMPKGIRLLATRKTLWGLLDKRAVAMGGGGTHRLHLSDAILVKDNHIAVADSLKLGIKRIFKYSRKVRFVEIELASPQEVEEFLGHYKKLKKHLREGDAIVVMLDNFTPAQIKKVIKPLNEADIFIEISGGVSERNIARYSMKGVSAISSGAITTQAPNLDLSLQIERK